MGRRKMYDADLQFLLDSRLRAQIAAAAAVHQLPVSEFCRQVLWRFCAAQESLASPVPFVAAAGLNAMLREGAAMALAQRELAGSPAPSQPAAGAMG